MQITKVDNDRNQNAKQYKPMRYIDFFRGTSICFKSLTQYYPSSDELIGKMFITQPTLSE